VLLLLLEVPLEGRMAVYQAVRKKGELQRGGEVYVYKESQYSRQKKDHHGYSSKSLLKIKCIISYAGEKDCVNESKRTGLNLSFYFTIIGFGIYIKREGTNLSITIFVLYLKRHLQQGS
jgi:hypothetical protein